MNGAFVNNRREMSQLKAEAHAAFNALDYRTAYVKFSTALHRDPTDTDV